MESPGGQPHQQFSLKAKRLLYHSVSLMDFSVSLLRFNVLHHALHYVLVREIVLVSPNL